MKIDKTTYNDRKVTQNGMTANHTSRPNKVLFFADPHFCFLRADPHLAHCLSPGAQAHTSQKSKSQNSPTHKLKNIFYTNNKIKKNIYNHLNTKKLWLN